MTWYDEKEAAADPDNPTAAQQLPFDEYNAMVDYLRDRTTGDWKLTGIIVDATAIADDFVLVYHATPTPHFEYEAVGGAVYLGDLTDVVITSVADNEVLAYASGTGWINQTAAEAGLAPASHNHDSNYYTKALEDTWRNSVTQTEMGYLDGVTSDIQTQLDGKLANPAAVDLDMADNSINGVNHFKAFDTSGMYIFDSANNIKGALADSDYAFISGAMVSMGTHKIINVGDPDAAQDAATKNYHDTHIAVKDFLTPTDWYDGYIPVYRTALGRFEMEAQSGGGGGVSNHSGLSELSFAAAGHTGFMANPAVADLDMGTHDIFNSGSITGGGSADGIFVMGGSTYGAAQIGVHDQYHSSQAGNINFFVSNSLTTIVAAGGFISTLNGGPCLGLNGHQIKALGNGTASNDAATVAQANTRYIQAELFDPNTAVTAGQKKVLIHMPFAGTLTAVHAEVKDHSTVGGLTIDVNKNNFTVLSTKLTIDQGDTGSDQAATPAVISVPAIVLNDFYTIDVDGAGANAKGLTVTCTIRVT